MELSSENNNNDNNSSMNSYLKTATDRGQALGETPIKPDSIFDLIRPADREFLLEKKQQLLLNTATPIVTKETPPKPNVKEQKAKRYEQFISFTRKNFKDPYSFVDTTNLTEWEKESEKEEFFSTYEKNMKKIDLIKSESLKFVSTSLLNEQNQEMDIEKPIESQSSSSSSLVSTLPPATTAITEAKEKTKKKYGKETRIEYEWRPHPTLCKRFNVPCPYNDNIKEYGTVRNDKFKAPKFSLFNVLSAGTRFDKEKTKSLFDELNADVPTVRQAANKTTIVMSDDGKSETKDKIEFETKIIDNDKKSKKSAFSFEAAMSSEDVDAKEASSKDLNKSNVYLQERPSFDLFKAIFENENDEEETNEEEKEDESDVEVISGDNDFKIAEPKIGQIETTVASSLNQIKYKDLSKYLSNTDREKQDEEEKNTSTISLPPALPDKIKFTQLVKSLATKSKTGKSSSSDDEEKREDEDSSEDSDDSEIQIVYEEVSISSNKKSHKKKSKKSKKKKKKSKKSKKSSEKE